MELYFWLDQKKSGKLYDSIWNKKQNESPLKVITRNVTKKLQKYFKKEQIELSFAMNYGYPRIGEQLSTLKKRGCEKILIFPMYPQYSATTTASVVDNVNRYLSRERWLPTIRFVPPYYDDKAYINALYQNIKKNVNIKTGKNNKILCSFHGIPKKYFYKGDPYHCHCAKTVRLLNEKI